MPARSLEDAAFSFYVEQLRRGSADPYVAYRVYEKSWQLPRKDASLVRRATIHLIEGDPWFLAMGTPIALSALEIEDLEHLTPFVGAGLARGPAAMLRAILWCWGRRGPYHPDRAGRAQLRRALGFLQKVPAGQRDVAWHQMLVNCCRAVDYVKYRRAFPKLLDVTDPASRASALHDFLNVVCRNKDWETYDRYRRAWDQLPPAHHACECYVHDVHTDDGLRAAAARSWEAIPEALNKAGAVRGCPHLNTGGLRLDLVRSLVSRNKHIAAVRMYLERAAAFPSLGKELAKLRRAVEQRSR